jgi:hypothetical protein
MPKRPVRANVCLHFGRRPATDPGLLAAQRGCGGVSILALLRHPEFRELWLKCSLIYLRLSSAGFGGGEDQPVGSPHEPIRPVSSINFFCTHNHLRVLRMGIELMSGAL